MSLGKQLNYSISLQLILTGVLWKSKDFSERVFWGSWAQPLLSSGVWPIHLSVTWSWGLMSDNAAVSWFTLGTLSGGAAVSPPVGSPLLYFFLLLPQTISQSSYYPLFSSMTPWSLTLVQEVTVNLLPMPTRAGEGEGCLCPDVGGALYLQLGNPFPRSTYIVLSDSPPTNCTPAFTVRAPTSFRLPDYTFFSVSLLPQSPKLKSLLLQNLHGFLFTSWGVMVTSFWFSEWFINYSACLSFPSGCRSQIWLSSLGAFPPKWNLFGFLHNLAESLASFFQLSVSRIYSLTFKCEGSITT